VARFAVALPCNPGALRGPELAAHWKLEKLNMPLLTSRTDVAVLRPQLADAYRAVRMTTLRLCQPLSSEDMVVQVDACASPTKWHLAHTTWFFETFVLQQHERDFDWHSTDFSYLYNSYYHAVGRMHDRPKRGFITRPTLEEVLVFRNAVDERIMALIEACDDETLTAIAPIIELGLNHEQQHQELMLTDIKLLFVANPLGIAYRTPRRAAPRPETHFPRPLGWIPLDEGVIEIGHEGDAFAYDNEGPRHRRFLEPFELADRLVTNGEYLEFLDDGGYEHPRHWLDDAWTRINSEHWTHPFYWRHHNGVWQEYTLDGWRALDPYAPACHISFFEADAYARWRGDRLPTEAEWEHASEQCEINGNFLESDALHPQSTHAEARSDESGRKTGVAERDSSDMSPPLKQLFGDVWEWTRSAHEPYPGYEPPEGAIGEYNGKFMNGSYVLRGGSCVTSKAHIRRTYRNFFEPGARWQFTGIRLARST
jgi:ergothioneine biosynthesis protein EgtB